MPLIVSSSTEVSIPDIKGFVDNPVVVDFEKLFTHRYTLANASTIRPIHSTNLIGSVKPEIGTPWGDIDAFVEIMRDLASNIPTRMLVEWSRGAEKEKNINLKIPNYFQEKNNENHKIEKMRTILIFRTVSKCCFLVFILMQLQFQFFHFRNNFSLMSGILTVAVGRLASTIVIQM